MTSTIAVAGKGGTGKTTIAGLLILLGFFLYLIVTPYTPCTSNCSRHSAQC